MKSVKMKIEEFIMSICKPRGVVPSRDDWARIFNMMGANQPFAMIIGRHKKHRYIELRPYPGNDLAHLYARTLNGQLRMGNAVLYSEHGLRPKLRICSLSSWTDDYRAIVPVSCRPREVQMCVCKPYRKPVECPNSTMRSDRFKPTDEDITFGNPYRRRCPMHGFIRTGMANRVMSYYGSILHGC